MLTNLEKEGKHSRRLEISSVVRSRSKNCVQSTCSLRNEPAIPVICWSSKSDTNLVFLLTTICILSKASTMSRFVSRYFLKSAGTNKPTFLYPDSVEKFCIQISVFNPNTKESHNNINYLSCLPKEPLLRTPWAVSWDLQHASGSLCPCGAGTTLI